MAIAHSDEKLKEKILACSVSNDSDCWIWNKSFTKRGYGRANYKGKAIYAHRLSYLIFNGEIAKGMFVCHKCDTPLCVNPIHLFAGTPKENSMDRDSKGRAKTVIGRRYKGVESVNSKLKDSDIIEIRKMRLTTNMTQREIAKEFGVVMQTVNGILTGKTWSHV